ncbi:MAG TPA: thioredoxin [Candidatus Paceibacterota bacterium]|nr:thioredoxin [Candidatus Paceibacterota bacterium]
MTKEISKSDFQKEVLENNLPVLVDFWAPWCQPCLMMAPILENVSQKYQDKLEIKKINIDLPQNQAVAEDYQIESIPNMKLFKNGKVIAEFIGLRSQALFEKELENYL